MPPKKAPKKNPPKKVGGDRTKKVIRPKDVEIKPIDEPEKEFSIEELLESSKKSFRRILLRAEGISTMFNLMALTPEKKVGYKVAVKMSENEELCIGASLSLSDNQVFFPSVEFEGKGKLTKKQIEEGFEEKLIYKSAPSGIKTGIYINEDGDHVHKKEIVEYDEEDRIRVPLPSSLYYKNSPWEIDITDTMTVTDILDTEVNSRYILFPSEDQSDVDFKDLINNLETIEPPKFLSFKFNYTKNTIHKDAFLMLIDENGEEYILMCVGKKIEISWVGLEEIPEENMYIEEDLELDLELEL